MATLTTDGSQSDVAAKISSASAGDIVEVPAGTYTWASGVTINKAIQVKGAGGGRLAGCSKTSLAIGTGSKAFTIHTAANGAATTLTSAPRGFTNGETIRAIYKPNGANYMEGTVTSYTGGVLTLDVTTTGGSGTYASWVLVADSQTKIAHSAGTSTLFTLTEAASGNAELSDLHMIAGTGTGSFVAISGNGQPVKWHDCRVSNTAGQRIVSSSINRGVLYNLGWDTGFNWDSAANNLVPGYGLTIKNDSATDAWETTSYFGATDTSGDKNLYVEDSYFCGLVTEAFDFDGNARGVVRHCVLDNSGITSHGADTGPVGSRHFQVLENLFVFENLGTATAGLNYWVYVRGGTGVLAGNVIPNISSSEWGDKPEITLTVQNLQRNAGPNPLWGRDIAGAQYPCPRQVGFGRVTGLGTDGTGRSVDTVTYVGDIEPWHQWDNAGTGSYASPSIANYATPAAGEDTVADYIQVGREWINSAKSGWSAYTYPHPLRSGESPPPATSSTPSPLGNRGTRAVLAGIF